MRLAAEVHDVLEALLTGLQPLVAALSQACGISRTNGPRYLSIGDATISADQIVIANTKGLTGHPMGVGIEDVVAVKALETALVPPVPNVQHTDPELGEAVRA